MYCWDLFVNWAVPAKPKSAKLVDTTIKALSKVPEKKNDNISANVPCLKQKKKKRLWAFRGTLIREAPLN